MILNVSKFGEVLMSRPAGKDAFLIAKAYILTSLTESDDIVLDFNNVKVLTPSWADEFITGIKQNYSNKLIFINTTNEAVAASLKTINK